jgi:hypothetical protein
MASRMSCRVLTRVEGRLKTCTQRGARACATIERKEGLAIREAFLVSQVSQECDREDTAAWV